MSTSSLSQQKWDAKYDILKFVLSLFVLSIHAGIYPMVLYPWLRIAVPLFFMMSSYFLFSKMRDASVQKQYVLLKKFAFRNLQLYLCWFIILLPLTLYIRRKIYFAGSFWENVFIFLRNALFGSTFIASWYIVATIIGVFIVYFLSRLLKKDAVVFFISLFTFSIVTLASSYMPVLANTFIANAIEKYIDIFGGLVCSFPAAVFWVFMGKMFAEDKIRIQSLGLLICLMIISCVGLFLEWKYVISLKGGFNNDSYFMLAPACVFLFMGIQKLNPIYWKHSASLKHASTVIYVAHGSIIHAVSKLISIVFHAEILLLSFILTLLCCTAIYVFIDIAIQKCPAQRITKVLKMLY